MPDKPRLTGGKTPQARRMVECLNAGRLCPDAQHFLDSASDMVSPVKILDRLDRIEQLAYANDQVGAEKAEKDLWEFVLRAIADNVGNAQSLARRALRSKEMRAEIQRAL